MDFDPSQLASALRKDEIDIGDLPNSQGGSFATGMINALKSGFTLPGDVATGQADIRLPSESPDLTRVADMTGVMTAGSLPAATRASGEAMLGSGPIRAYHGSPHDFDRFDLSKIGTGEGAQVYGHGLYFAENPEVAQSYRDILAGQHYIDRAGNKFVPEAYPAAEKALTYLDVAKGDFDKARATLTERLNDWKGADTAHGINQQAMWAKSLDVLDEMKQLGLRRPGHTYEVAIHADPERFLDWDKGIGHQGPNTDIVGRGVYGPAWDEVQNAHATLASNPRPSLDEMRADPRAANDLLGKLHNAERTLKDRWDIDPGRSLGTSLYDIGKGDVARASSILSEQGIPGIKYLDQGSRAAGDGSRNYVTFSDDIVQILRKYGVASMAALPPAVQMMLLPNDHPRDGAQE